LRLLRCGVLFDPSRREVLLRPLPASLVSGAASPQGDGGRKAADLAAALIG
jgi:hypothetical protein